MSVLVEQNRQLQMELLKRDQRIAELGGGQANVGPTKAAGELGASGQSGEDPFKAVDIQFSRVTGGLNLNGKGGDEGLRVAFSPVDKNGDAVKRAGSLELDLYDLAIQDTDKRIGHWEYTVEQVSRSWVSGFGTNAFAMELKWPKGQAPKHRDLTLLARFVTLDGRSLTATKNFKVELPPETPETPEGEKPAAEPAKTAPEKPAVEKPFGAKPAAEKSAPAKPAAK